MKPEATATGNRPRSLGVALAWGLAESTCFFLIPDVWTSRLALGDLRLALKACIASLAGALLGGTLLYGLGQDVNTASTLRGCMDWIPGISPGLLEAARHALNQQGALALFTGMSSGIPYKLYALQASTAGVGLGIFLAASVAARLLRFVLVTGVVWLVSRTLLSRLTLAGRQWIHAAGWLVFYVAYYRAMGW